MRGLTLIAPPTAEPVTLAEAKAHLRLDATTEDSLVTDLIAAARQAAESHLKRALVTQTWRLSLDRFPTRPASWWDGVRLGAETPATATHVSLPRPPLQSVATITIYDDADSPSVMPATDYFVDVAHEPGRVALRAGKSWPAVGRVAAGVEIDFVAGYGGQAAVPQAIGQGILMLVAHFFEHREAVATAATPARVPYGVAALWRPYRVIGL